MSHRYDTVSFLSDYGTVDEFVGVVKAVLRDLAGHAVVIDLTHEIPPHDVRAGALALARCVQYVPAGVVLAVVDPGVGTDRRAVAVEVGDGVGVFVGPDNGLLAPAVAMAGGATRAVALTDTEYHLPAVGATFAGRDVFAPVAAHLCNGVPLGAFGPEIDPAGLLPGVVPLLRVEGGELHAEVLWVDRYGNAQLNVGPDDVTGLGDRIAVRAGSDLRTARLVSTYGDLAAGQLGLVIDSYGLLSLAFDRQPAARELGIRAGDAVLLAEPEGPEPGVTTRVAFPGGSGAPRR